MSEENKSHDYSINENNEITEENRSLESILRKNQHTSPSVGNVGAEAPKVKEENSSVHTSGAPTVSSQNRTPVWKTASQKPRVVDFDEIDPENAKIRKEKVRSKALSDGTHAAVGLIKTLIYIALVLAISAALSITIINIANDVFAFVKDDTEVTVTIPEGADTKQVADILHENGLIKYPGVFTKYIGGKIEKSSYMTGKYIAGEYALRPTMNYEAFMEELAEYTIKARETVKITIPEGFTVDEIIALLVENGIGTKEKYVDAINNFEYEYRFVTELMSNGYSDDRKYRLEGYLFPDTYEFFTDENEISVINKMLMNFDNKFEELYYEEAANLGYTVDDVIVLASILEKEAIYKSDLAKMASVFYNRLRSGWRLDSDATIMYALPERKKSISAEDIAFESPYNTRKYGGLTPGAISNPGLDAINAAFFPVKENYYYFFSLNDGTTVYSRTQYEHDTAIAKAKAEGTFDN